MSSSTVWECGYTIEGGQPFTVYRFADTEKNATRIALYGVTEFGRSPLTDHDGRIREPEKVKTPGALNAWLKVRDLGVELKIAVWTKKVTTTTTVKTDQPVDRGDVRTLGDIRGWKV